MADAFSVPPPLTFPVTVWVPVTLARVSVPELTVTLTALSAMPVL